MAAKLFAVVLVLATSVMADEAADPRTESVAQLESAKQLIKEGDYVEAVKALNALSANARLSEVQMELGRCFKALGENDLAIQAYSMAIIAPQIQTEQVLKAYAERGNLYLETGRIPEAIDDFTQAIQLDPTNADNQYGRGLALIELSKRRSSRDQRSRREDIEGAVKSFDSAIRFSDDYALAYFERGMARLMLGQESEAQTDLSRALSISPGDFAPRLVEIATQQQTQINELRSKLVAQEADERADEDEATEVTELLREIRDLLRLQTYHNQPAARSSAAIDRSGEADEVALERRLLLEHLTTLQRRLGILEQDLNSMVDAAPSERESKKEEIRNIARVRDEFFGKLTRLEKQK